MNFQNKSRIYAGPTHVKIWFTNGIWETSKIYNTFKQILNPFEMNIELLKNDWLNFVELNISGDNENVFRCHPESSFIEGDVFNLFTPCFENSNHLFEFFGQTRYNSRLIIPLQNELKNHLSIIEKLKNAKEIRSFADDIFLGYKFISELGKIDPQWEKTWTKYHAQLIRVNLDLIALTNRCIEQERVLWVIGY